jgi:hypothetical protein
MVFRGKMGIGASIEDILFDFLISEVYNTYKITIFII